MRHDSKHMTTGRGGCALALAAGLALAVGVPEAAAQGRSQFAPAAGPAWNCPPALQSQAANCVAAFIVDKDMRMQVCPCDRHGAGFSTMPIPSDWTQTTYPLEITKWRPAKGTDPCMTYTIGGVLQQICW
jgi:hypothetical protein